MNKGDKFNSNFILEKKRKVLIEENNNLYEMKDQLLRELNKLRVFYLELIFNIKYLRMSIKLWNF